MYTVCFFGHRNIRDLRRIDEKLIPILTDLIRTKPYLVFAVGRNGEFDEYVASVIKRVQKEWGKDNSSLTLVLPYTVSDLAYYEKYYDDIIIPDHLHGTHPKSAITMRNQWMVEQADLVIVNVEKMQGGAYAAMKYAERQAKKAINLADTRHQSDQGP